MRKGYNALKNIDCDIVIIGGGPAGLFAAKAASENGAKSILVIERDRELGGILQQCIHNGFGLHLFKEELTGPTYAERCYDLVKDDCNITFMVDTMVIDIREGRTVIASSPKEGLLAIKAGAVILAMGCRERTRGAIRIAGSRPAGVFTAGAAQRMVNMEGVLPGKSAVILGSGDIGLIMARRLTLEGVDVKACLELMPFSNGLTRNIVQCLDDYGIPLYLSHTVSEVYGKDRVEKLICTKVDEKYNPVHGSEFEIECDTLLLSVGLIPENELSKKIGVPMHHLTQGPLVDQNRQTLIEGVFAAGNVLHVHDLADFASEEAMLAGAAAAGYVRKGAEYKRRVDVKPGSGIRTVVPQFLSVGKDSDRNIKLFMRAACPMDNVRLNVKSGGKEIASRSVRFARPSEMMTYVLKGSDMNKLEGELEIELVAGK